MVRIITGRLAAIPLTFALAFHPSWVVATPAPDGDAPELDPADRDTTDPATADPGAPDPDPIRTAPSTEPPAAASRSAPDPQPAASVGAAKGGAARPDGEVIEVEGDAPARPAQPGVIQLGGRDARRAPGALGEPFRAIAMLPGVVMPIASVGYPVIRGSMPGESRFSFDGIEVPQLYHLVLGNQVMHPGFLGDLELRAGGYGAEHGHLLGGLITLTPSADPDDNRTELRSTVVELGAFHARRLSKHTTAVAAVRVGTLSVLAKIVSPRSNLTYADQQLRVVHRLGNGDQLLLTSLGSIDHVAGQREDTLYLGFHRLDLRWQRSRPGLALRAGFSTELDILGSRAPIFSDDPDGDGNFDPVPPGRYGPYRGMTGRGLKPYAQLSFDAARWLTLRGGLEARYRWIRAGAELLPDDFEGRDYLQPARSTGAAGAWLAGDLRAGRVTITPGVRADTYHAVHPLSDRRHNSLDPRLAVSVELASNLRAELAGGLYTAPPQATLVVESFTIGPLPSTDGIGAPAGMSRARQIQTGVRATLPDDVDASLAAYWRNTHYALDFSMADKDFSEIDRMPCGSFFDDEPSRYHDTDIDTDALGVEIMVRRGFKHRLSGWVSYSLAKVDRDLPTGRQAHDFDQRHTANAALQWKKGAWTLGAGLHVHSGRPALYPRVYECFDEQFGPYLDGINDPTHLRRLPPSWRPDLRAERTLRFSSWTGRVIFEFQNAALRSESIGYTFTGTRVITDKIRIPVPMVGFEADF
jgi:hypothetical protein